MAGVLEQTFHQAHRLGRDNVRLSLGGGGTVVDGRARMQIVSIGLSNATAIQITSGVQPGETVVLPGSITLSDGESIVASAPATTGAAPPTTVIGG